MMNLNDVYVSKYSKDKFIFVVGFNKSPFILPMGIIATLINKDLETVKEMLLAMNVTIDKIFYYFPTKDDANAALTMIKLMR